MAPRSAWMTTYWHIPHCRRRPPPAPRRPEARNSHAAASYYAEDEHGLWLCSPIDAVETRTQLTNFGAKIVADIVEDDGTTTHPGSLKLRPRRATASAPSASPPKTSRSWRGLLTPSAPRPACSRANTTKSMRMRRSKTSPPTWSAGILTPIPAGGRLTGVVLSPWAGAITAARDAERSRRGAWDQI